MNRVMESFSFKSGRRLEIIQGDLLQEPVDAIVNAANPELAHGGGVAGLISRRGGPTVDQESLAWVRQHGPVPHDSPAYTTAGNLPFRCIIHAVGPKWGEGGEDEKLASAVTGCLMRADELRLKSIAMPAISCGIFRFPPDRAAGVIFAAVEDYLSRDTAGTLELVRLVLHEPEMVRIFLEQLDRRNPT